MAGKPCVFSRLNSALSLPRGLTFAIFRPAKPCPAHFITAFHHRLRCQRTRRALRLTCLLAGTAVPLQAQQSTTPEYRSKATFLATFPNFVEWPLGALSSLDSPFRICVRGDFSFGTSLAEMARRASSHGRRTEVRWVHKDEELRHCQLAFVSRSEAARYSKLFQALEGTGVLTVGETEGFLPAGRVIAFSYERDALQFEVNLVAAESAHLKISSRLLVLAGRPIQTDAGPLQASMSLGLLLSSDWGNRPADELLREADAALYAAKTAGRNCVRVAKAEGSLAPVRGGKPVGERLP
jgi:hypothetical protein